MTSRFGLSSHLFHGERLSRDHLAAVSAHGFQSLELYATRTHFDYHDPAAAEALAEWLGEARLALHAVHAPTTMSFAGGQWGDTISLASAQEEQRQFAVAETIPT